MRLIVYYLFLLIFLGLLPIFFFLKWYWFMVLPYPLIIAYSNFMNPLRKIGYDQHKLRLGVPSVIILLIFSFAVAVTNLAGYFTYMNTHTLDRINCWLFGLLALLIVPIVVWDQIRFARRADTYKRNKGINNDVAISNWFNRD